MNAPASGTSKISHLRKPVNQINSVDFCVSQTQPWQKYYKMGKLIGKGAFSRVFEAFEIRTGLRYALKEIPKNHFKYVAREIEIMKRVRHENILNCREIFEDDFSIYLVLEHVEGGELYEKIEKNGPYSEAEAKEIVVQIIAAVDYLHQQKIAHRDLKPENILCIFSDKPNSGFRFEKIKLADFGLSKEFAFENLHTLCGSPTYVAPELLKGNYDERIDLWAIGVITYILLTAYFPFYDEKDVKELYKKIIAVNYTFPDGIALSDEAKDFISKLIVGDPSQRMTPAACWQHPWLKDSRLLPKYTSQSYSLSGSSSSNSNSNSNSNSHSESEDEDSDEEPDEFLRPRSGSAGCEWLDAPDGFREHEEPEDDNDDSSSSSDSDEARMDT